jgi:cardiolipin synthase
MRRLADAKADLQLPAVATRLPKEADTIDRLLQSYGIPGATGDNRFTLCANGEDTYRALVELIDQAQRSIHITTFILHPDEVGTDVLRRLARRAAEGVEVRLLLDGVGSLHTSRHFLAPLVEAGGRVAFFIPVIHRPFRGRTNLRNHRKLVIVDDSRCLAGGTNIASEYIGPRPVPGRWRDLSFVLEGPAVTQCAYIFRSDWEFASGESLRAPEIAAIESTSPQSEPAHATDSAIVQIVPSGPDVAQDTFYDALLSMVFGAQKRIWMVTPYFIPDETLARSLVLAAHRGIDVRLIMPRTSNHRMADFARGTYLRDLQAAGAKIELYEPGMLHAKVILVDRNVAVVGSANIDMRSLFLNFEVAAYVYTAAEIAAVEAWVDDVLAHSTRGVATVGTVRDLTEGLARMLGPLL